MAKLIGISPRLLTEDNVEKQFINTRYLKPLTKRGFNTVMLTLENPNLEEILGLCDAFLITGGTDIDPVHFNEKDLGISKGVDLRLDEVDKQIVLHAYRNRKPLLGICRGLQSINVFLGGTIYQDIGKLNKNHNSVKENHIVKTIRNSFLDLEAIIHVNSYHHQAIKDLANNLVVLGTHEDDTIEIIAHRSLPIFAVQWHPEINSESEVSRIIFNKFAELINK